MALRGQAEALRGGGGARRMESLARDVRSATGQPSAQSSTIGIGERAAMPRCARTAARVAALFVVAASAAAPGLSQELTWDTSPDPGFQGGAGAWSGRNWSLPPGGAPEPRLRDRRRVDNRGRGRAGRIGRHCEGHRPEGPRHAHRRVDPHRDGARGLRRRRRDAHDHVGPHGRQGLPGGAALRQPAGLDAPRDEVLRPPQDGRREARPARTPTAASRSCLAASSRRARGRPCRASSSA